MKNLKTISIIFLFTVMVSACKKSTDNSPATTQEPTTGTLYFHLHTDVDTNEVDNYGDIYVLTGGRKISVIKAQLYISNIQLVRADSSVYTVPNTVLLKMQETEPYLVGNVPAGNYVTVRFTIGLDSATNAKVTKDNAASSISSIVVGDTIMVQGTVNGTTVTAKNIFDGKMIPKRNEDSHDVLGTFKAIMEQPIRSKPPKNEDDFLAWLQQCNHQILSSRPDKNPGQWKEESNQAGNTIFVHPELVKGTLREGFKRVALLEDPFARALMAMFIVTEVHPFMDGNGRTARLTMNAYLTQASACRIIVPTGYREDYLLPLKALSQNNDPTPFVRSMTRAWNWTAGFDYSDFAKLWEKMKACNAFTDNPSQYQLLDPRDIS